MLAVMLPSISARADQPKKITYEEDVLPLFRNSCLNCHNPDKKKAGLDLSNYSALMAGSDNGKVVMPGDPGGSLLAKTISHTEEPFMPKNGDKLPPAQLALITGWISGGALETSSSHAAVSQANNDLNVVIARIGKPPGPPPMPTVRLSLEPVMHTARPGAISALATSPWAPLVAVAGPHQIVLFNTQTLDLLGIFPAPDDQVNVLRFCQDGSLLLAAGGEAAKTGRVTLYDVTTTKKVAQIGNEFDAVLAADISPDHAMVAVGTTAKILRAYDVRTGQPVFTMKKHTDWVTAVAFSPDGLRLASGDRAGNLYVVEAKTGRDLYTLSGHKDAITALAFRDDGNILASASQDGTVKFWGMRDGSQIRNANAHGSGVLSLSFAHDGRLVTAGRDNLARIWTADLNNSKPTDAMSDAALQCAFTDDGKRVIVGDWSGQLKVFTAENAAKVGDLTADPAAPADRLIAARDHVKDLRAETQKFQTDVLTAKVNLNKAEAAVGIARSGQGAGDIQSAMRQVDASLSTVRQATKAWNDAKALAELKKTELDLLSQKKVRLALALENAKNDQARQNIQQRIDENQKQLEQATKGKADADNAVPQREQAYQQAMAQQKSAGEAMAKAMTAADPQARELPSRIQSLRNANIAMTKANQTSGEAAAKLKSAEADLQRLQASIAAASSPQTQPTRAALN